MAEKSGWMEKRQHERFLAALKVGYRIIPAAEAQTVLAQDSYRETTAARLPMISQASPLYEAVTQDISLGGDFVWSASRRFRRERWSRSS